MNTGAINADRRELSSPGPFPHDRYQGGGTSDLRTRSRKLRRVHTHALDTVGVNALGKVEVRTHAMPEFALAEFGQKWQGISKINWRQHGE